MTTKSAIKYASIDEEPVKEVATKKSPRKSNLKSVGHSNRRSQSLDRLDDHSGDSREERRNRRQYMHLVSGISSSKLIGLESFSKNLYVTFTLL